MVFLFTTNMIVPFRQKNKDDLLSKNTFKDDIHLKKIWYFF